MSEMIAVKGSTARRKDPACGTCRKKCRKCDRARPICRRCRSKGLHCEGYPPRFQFADVSTSRAPDEGSSSSNASLVAPLPKTTSPGDRTAARPLPIATTTTPDPAPQPSTEVETLGAGETPHPRSLLLTMSSSPSVKQSSTGSPLSQTALSYISYDATKVASQGTYASARDSVVSPGSISAPRGTSFEHNTSPTDADQRSFDEVPGPDEKSFLIAHFKYVLSEALTVSIGEASNPFREHLLPLAYQHDGVMHALLGLAACHVYMSGKNESQKCITTALQHRVAALRSLGALLIKEEMAHLVTMEEEAILAMVLLLVTHDICETGVSSHGTHLTGVEFLCSRLARPDGYSKRSKTSMFLVSALTWLDMLRGFSGAEKLTYSVDVRACVRDHGSLSLHCLVGCPPAIFYRIGVVLQAAKDQMAGRSSMQELKQVLDDAEKFLRGWDPEQVTYPTAQQEWKQLAEAFRHACLLRIMRFPDAFVIPCTDARIQESVTAILDVSAQMPRDSVFYKRLLFPLFLAGADTSSPHQIHYTSWCISEIKQSTGFQHPAMTELLTSVWDERRHDTRGWTNVPWMEFTCSTLLETQHAYLFF